MSFDLDAEVKAIYQGGATRDDPPAAQVIAASMSAGFRNYAGLLRRTPAPSGLGMLDQMAYRTAFALLAGDIEAVAARIWTPPPAADAPQADTPDPSVSANPAPAASTTPSAAGPDAASGTTSPGKIQFLDDPAPAPVAPDAGPVVLDPSMIVPEDAAGPAASDAPAVDGSTAPITPGAVGAPRTMVANPAARWGSLGA